MNKSRNLGQWTEARFRSFIVSALRSASQRWGPKNECLRKARIRRGWYLCEGCKQEVPATKEGVYKSGAKKGKKKRIKNILADHIEPIVDPKEGFKDWNTWIERCFVELDGYQALCHDCHEAKTNEEKAMAKKRKKK